MSKIEPMKVSDVPVLPPWEREECHYSEVPAILKHLHNLTMQPKTVYRWITHGLPQQAEPSKRSYLIAVRRAGRLFVRRADLMKFLQSV